MERKYIVYVPKIGTLVDDNAFGGHVIDREFQKRLIERRKNAWRKTISSPLQLVSKMVKNAPNSGRLPCELMYYYIDNPYYGWKEDQLEIRFR